MFKPALFFLYISLLMILINPIVSADGAAKGLCMWLNTLIPTLFPYIIISKMLLKVYGNSMKKATFFISFMGVLCGFPICAILANRLMKERKITPNTAQFLVNSFNLASPMYILCILCKSVIPDCGLIPVFLCIYLADAFVVLIMYYIYHPSFTCNTVPVTKTLSFRDFLRMTDDSVFEACISIVKIGGYIIVFSMFCSYISILNINPLLKAALLGLTELTNGLDMLSTLPETSNIRNCLSTALTAFGGICTLFQTISVVDVKDISYKQYLLAKMLYAAVTYILSVLLL